MRAVAANDRDALLTEVGAADLLCLSVRTLQAWRARGFGPPYVRAGRAVRYRRCDLLAWAEARVVIHREEPRKAGRGRAEPISSSMPGEHPHG
jgi:Helix-turn-helix domain